MSFDGKTIIVTGGSRGIGRAIVQTFVTSGASVSVIDVAPAEASSGGLDKAVDFFAGAVSRVDDVHRFVTGVIARFGRLDVLVNNAGILRDNGLWPLPGPEFDSVVAVNL